jgi:hypothetical protein
MVSSQYVVEKTAVVDVLLLSERHKWIDDLHRTS